MKRIEVSAEQAGLEPPCPYSFRSFKNSLSFFQT